MKRWIACLLAMGMIATLNTALALSKNGEGLYVDANGNVIDESEDEWGTHMPGYYIGEGVAYPIDGDSGSSSVPAPSYSSSGGMTVSSSDGSLNSLPDTAIINPDGSVTLQSGSMQIDAGSDGTGSGHLTEAEWAARLAKANAKLGVTTGVAYIDVNGDPHPATIETLGLGRSTIVVDGTRMLVPTASIVWDTEAPEDKVLAVVTTTKQTYATMRAKKSQKAFVMGHAEKCTVLLVISTGKTWTLIDNQGVRGYVLTSTLTFYDNKPRQYAAGIITVKGKATTKGSTVHVRSSKSNKARILKYTLSSDLQNVTYDGIIFTDPETFWNLECSDTFTIGDKYYLTYSGQDDTLWYAYSDTPYGPYSDPIRLDGDLFYAAKHAEDGKDVYMIGWARRSESVSSTQEVSGWAGNLAVQKVEQNPDGTLTLTPVDELLGQYKNRRQLLVDGMTLSVEAGSSYNYTELCTAYESFVLSGKISFEKNGSFGFAFDYNGRTEKYKTITLDPKDDQILLQFNEGDTTITQTAAVTDPGKIYEFTYIQDGSVGIFYLDGIASLTVRLYGVSGKPIRLFAENNSVTLSDLKLYTK